MHFDTLFDMLSRLPGRVTQAQRIRGQSQCRDWLAYYPSSNPDTAIMFMFDRHGQLKGVDVV
jgi:hypothetical protein